MTKRTEFFAMSSYQKGQSKGVLTLLGPYFPRVRYGDLCLRHTPTGCLSGFSCFFVVAYITRYIQYIRILLFYIHTTCFTKFILLCFCIVPYLLDLKSKISNFLFPRGKRHLQKK